MALGAMRAFKEQGCCVPRDMAITGFDNIGAATLAGLTTVSIPRFENGYLAAKKLLSMVAGGHGGETIKLCACIKQRGTTV